MYEDCCGFQGVSRVLGGFGGFQMFFFGVLEAAGGFRGLRGVLGGFGRFWANQYLTNSITY